MPDGLFLPRAGGGGQLLKLRTSSGAFRIEEWPAPRPAGLQRQRRGVPGAEQPAKQRELSEMVSIVVGHYESLPQNGLSRPMWNSRRQVGSGIADELLHPFAVFREAGDASGPRRVIGRRAVRRPVVVRESKLDVVGLHAEVEDVALRNPQVLDQLPATVRDGIVTAYADALAPVFWYVLPFIGVAFVLSLFLKQVPLSDVAGLVARGEAVGGEEAERLEAEQRASADARTPRAARAADPGDASNAPERDRRER